MRQAAKIDANQRAIVKTLRKVGCKVISLAAVGNGCPDLLVLLGDKFTMIEVKDGTKPPSKRRLTPHQLIFHEEWPVVVVTDETEALRAVGL